MKLAPVMIETALHEVEQKCGIATANMLRAYHLSLRARIDEDLKEDDEAIVIPPPDTNLSNHPADVPAAKKTADYDE